MFSINCLEITADKSQWEQNKSLYKNLLSDEDFIGLSEDTPVNKRYLFNDYYKFKTDGTLEKNPNRALPENFFGKNINVQAIVGKNGSGKSSLMDLMYMAINNFVYMFERSEKKENNLFFINNLESKLYFTIDFKDETDDITKEHMCTLECDKTLLSLRAISKQSINSTNNIEETIQINILIDEFELNTNGRSEPKFKGRETSEIIEIAKKFFYTIVSNYSLQSFISNNYKQNISRHKKKRHDSPQKTDVIENEKYCWIDPLFHKTDGYIKSIVFNPYRKGGSIDLNNEINLSKDRLSSLLIFSLNSTEKAFHPYSFNKIITHDNNKIDKMILELSPHKPELEDLRPFNPIPLTVPDYSTFLAPLLPNNSFYFPKKEISMDEFNKKVSEWEVHQKKFKDTLLNPDNQFANQIRRKKSLSNVDSSKSKECLAYIQLKILKIIKTYPSYEKYKDCIQYSFYEDDIKIPNPDLFRELIAKILDDPSHIATKIRRSINFIKKDNGFIPTECGCTFYEPKISAITSIDEINDLLPPPIYDYELIVDKSNDNGEIVQTEIPYNQLSSGEIQLLQTLSIHAYHIGNLITVSNDRPKYSNINLIFDELEVCLHPEYQREFTSRLIKMLTALKKDDIQFNVFIITHSPFVLSDIPRSNILYMLTEEDKGKELPKYTFAQNIGEMMYDSFFMDKTIGDFAESKLKRIIKIRQGRNPDNNDGKYNDDDEGKNLQKIHKKEMEMNLALIGDPVIRSLIEEIEYKEASND